MYECLSRHYYEISFSIAHVIHMARISHQELSAVFHRLGTALRAGVDILRAWEPETRRGSSGHRQVMASIYERLRRGESVAEALGVTNGYFPAMSHEMIRIGERTGHLDSVMLHLGEHYRKLVRLRREFVSSITWPLVELAIAILVIALLIWLPGFLGSTVDILGWGLMGTSGLIKYFAIILIIAAIGTVLVLSLARGYWGPAPVKLAMRIPVVGPFFEYSALTRFTWSLAVAMEAGLDARETMRMALRSTSNPVYRAAEPLCDRELERGNEFHEAMAAAGVFRRDLLDSIQAADLSGTHTEMLLRLSADYEERSQAAGRRLAFVAGCAIGTSIALFIIYFIFRFFFFYLGLINDALKI